METALEGTGNVWTPIQTSGFHASGAGARFCFPILPPEHLLPQRMLGCIWFFKNLFIYFWLRWVLVAARGPSPVTASGGHPSLWCAGPSLRWPLLPWSTGSRCAGFSSRGSWAPEHRLSSCGSRAQLLCGMWDPPGPGLEPASPELAGGLPTTAPPGKPRCIWF